MLVKLNLKTQWRTIYVILWALMFNICKAEEEIAGVIILFRPGTSTPRNKISSDNSSWFSQYTPGSLLPAGKRQTYTLGRQMYLEYQSLLKSYSYPKSIIELTAMNSNAQITGMEAFSVGLLQNISSTEIKRDVQPPWSKPVATPNFSTPLPGGIESAMINSSETQTLDYLFGLSEQYACPNINLRSTRDEIKRVDRIFSNSNFTGSLESALNTFSLSATTRPLKDTTNLYKGSRIFEYIVAEYHATKTPRISKSSRVYNDMRIAYESYVMTTQQDPQTSALVNSPIAKAIERNLRSIMLLPPLRPGNRIFAYSGHDKFMLGFLIILKLISPECVYGQLEGKPRDADVCVEFPHPSSSFIIELVKISSKETGITKPYVKLKYNGRYVGLGAAKLQVLEDPKIELKRFIDYLLASTVDKWEDECGLGKFSSSIGSGFSKWGSILLGSCILLLLLLFTVVYFFYRKEQIERASRNTIEQPISGRTSL